MNRFSAFALLVTANPQLGSAFQVRPLLPAAARINHQLSPKKNVPLYLSDDSVEELDKNSRTAKGEDGSSNKDPTWSSWDDEAAKQYFQSTGSERKSPGEKSDPTTWTNEPPDYINSGDPSNKKKKEAASSFASTTSNSNTESEEKTSEDDDEEAPENKVRPPLSTLFEMEEAGSLVADKSTSPWDFVFDSDRSPFNILEGRLGERGEAWTAVSLVLFLSVLGGGIPLPFLNSALTFLAGPGLMLVGVGLILASVNDLGSNNLTPFLTPTSRGSLVTDGIYGKIRHPIYSGLISLCGGFSILTEDSNRLVLSAVLFFLLGLKADKEEEELLKKFPQYAEYQDRSGKFFPGDWSFRS